MDVYKSIEDLANNMAATLGQLEATNDALARFAMDGQAQRLVVERLMQEVAATAPDPQGKVRELTADLRAAARKLAAPYDGKADRVIVAMDEYCSDYENALKG